MTAPTYSEEELRRAMAWAREHAPMAGFGEAVIAQLRRNRGEPGVQPRLTNRIRERIAAQERRRGRRTG